VCTVVQDLLAPTGNEQGGIVTSRGCQQLYRVVRWFILPVTDETLRTVAA